MQISYGQLITSDALAPKIERAHIICNLENLLFSYCKRLTCIEHQHQF